MEKQSNAVIGSLEWIEEQKAICDAATPGPWRWDVNEHSKDIKLLAEYPEHYYVMGFERWGTQGAQPIFQIYDRYDGPVQERGSQGMKKAIELATWNQDYRHDDGTIDHPDAIFIVAASAGYRAALDALEASIAREAEKDAEIKRLKTGITLNPSALLSLDQMQVEQKLRYGLKYMRPVTLDANEVHLAMNAIGQTARLTAERDAEKRRADAAVQAAVHRCWMVHKAGEAGYPEPRIVAGRCFGYGGADDEPMCERCEACGLCVDNTFAHTGPCAENAQEGSNQNA